VTRGRKLSVKFMNILPRCFIKRALFLIPAAGAFALASPAYSQTPDAASVDSRSVTAVAVARAPTLDGN